MRRVALAVLLAVATCAVAAAPATAAPAAPSLPQNLSQLVQQKLSGLGAEIGPEAPSFEATIVPAGPPGYEVEVFGVGRSVAIAIGHKSKTGLMAATYAVRGTITRNRVEAHFGNLGSISMRFQPSAPARGRCLGRFRLGHARGLYVGRLRFRGEGGYINLDTRRARGAITSVSSCPGHGERSTARTSSTKTYFEPELSYLTAAWKHGVSSVGFLAIGDKKGGAFLVSSEASRGGMAIERTALIAGRRALLTADDALTSGRVQGPAPFHGAATYAAGADGVRTWQGKLTINLLGEPRLPLTGPQFDEVELGSAPELSLLFFLIESL